jgi:hypothetical protein
LTDALSDGKATAILNDEYLGNLPPFAKKYFWLSISRPTNKWSLKIS